MIILNNGKTMKFFSRRSTINIEDDQLSFDPDFSQERADVFHRITLALLQLLKAFAQGDQEIQADQFKATLDRLGEQFNRTDRPKHQELHFEREKVNLLKFIEKQNSYLVDRDRELRDIIDLLSKAMAGFNVENREFYQRVYDESEKIIAISRLEDIKKIKNSLQHQVEQMRAVVDLKRDQENRHMQRLSGQVDILRQELELAKEKSLTDGLTGIYNRSAFDEHLAKILERYHMLKDGFALLMLDIDNFKAINDKYGHLIGDRALVAFAQKCRNAIRSDDFLARYGGEEFAIILPGANLGNALKKAMGICQLIAGTRYAANNSTSDDHLSITVSIGVCAAKKDDTIEKLLARADKALYDAKNSGKNRALARK